MHTFCLSVSEWQLKTKKRTSIPLKFIVVPFVTLQTVLVLSQGKWQQHDLPQLASARPSSHLMVILRLFSSSVQWPLVRSLCLPAAVTANNGNHNQIQLDLCVFPVQTNILIIWDVDNFNCHIIKFFTKLQAVFILWRNYPFALCKFDKVTMLSLFCRICARYMYKQGRRWYHVTPTALQELCWSALCIAMWNKLAPRPAGIIWDVHRCWTSLAPSHIATILEQNCGVLNFIQPFSSVIASYPRHNMFLEAGFCGRLLIEAQNRLIHTMEKTLSSISGALPQTLSTVLLGAE